MLENTTTTARSDWSAERLALVTGALRGNDGLAGRVRLQVHGESMLPAVWPGDVVEIAGCSLEDVRRGEVLLAEREGRLYLHRLVAVSAPSGFVLRGDSMPGSDPLFPSEALLGRLLRRGQCLAPKRESGFDELAVSRKRYPADNQSPAGEDTAAPRRGFGANWIGAKWSRGVGMLLCHCNLARRLALGLHRRRTASTRDIRNPESARKLGT
jgi:hypothetical protein